MAALLQTHSPKQGRRSLGNLPTEVVIEIMKQSPNFSCLWSLMNASSRFNSIFMTIPLEMVREVIKKAPLTTQADMRTVLVRRTTPHSHQEISPQVLRDFVELAHIIHGVAHACLEFYVEKSMNLKPQRIDDARDLTKISNMLFSDYQSPGRPFQPEKYGPPSYVEEQRVIRLLWRLQILLGASDLEKKTIPELLIERFKIEQFHAIVDFMTEMTEGQYSEPENLLAHFLHSPPTDIYNRGYHLPCFPKPTLPKHIDHEIGMTPVGWKFYDLMTGWKKESPLIHVSFEPYRKFGFAFWDAERMVKLGVVDHSPLSGPVSNRLPLYYTWRSILTPEEDLKRRPDAVKRRMREQKNGKKKRRRR